MNLADDKAKMTGNANNVVQIRCWLLYEELGHQLRCTDDKEVALRG